MNILPGENEIILDVYSQLQGRKIGLSLDDKVDLIYDYLNYYDDGSKVVDVDGNILDRISHRKIKSVIYSYLEAPPKPGMFKNLMAKMGK